MVAELAELRQLQIQRIVESKAFRTSEIQRNLLQYLADKALAGEGDSIKEYTIGLDVFSKPASFDPRQESSVRMHVARLRQKLAEYYRTEGIADTLIVDLPKGGFRLMFEERETAVAAESVVDEAKPRKAMLAWSTAALLTVVVGVGFAFYAMGGSDAPAAASATVVEEPVMSAELDELWAPFFNSPRPILVSLTAERDSASGAGTANGAFFLGQFLTPNRKREVVVTRSDQISMPEIAMDNVVFVGPTAGIRQIESIPMSAPLVLDAKGVRNVKPRPGEPAFLADKIGTADGSPEETYALVSHVPGLYGNGQILLLEGNRTSSVMAAVKSFTDPGLARRMSEALKAGGKLPRFYQVVLRVRSMDEMPVEVVPVLQRVVEGH
jgi:hypothetical protein